MDETISCFIGIELNDECHKLAYCCEKGFAVFSKYSANEKKLIKLRSEVASKEDDNIYLHHEAVFLTKYEWLQKYCCDQNKKERKIRKLFQVSLVLSLVFISNIWNFLSF